MSNFRRASPWSSVVVAIVLVAGCGSDEGSSVATSTPATSDAMTGSTAASSSTSTSASIQVAAPDLPGTWSARETTVTIFDCAVGDECGLLELIDDNRERCLYTLTYVSGDAAHLEFETGSGNSFGCGYSAWSNGLVRLTSRTPDTIEVYPVGFQHLGFVLTRVGN